MKGAHQTDLCDRGDGLDDGESEGLGVLGGQGGGRQDGHAAREARGCSAWQRGLRLLEDGQGHAQGPAEHLTNDQDQQARRQTQRQV